MSIKQKNGHGIIVKVLVIIAALALLCFTAVSIYRFAVGKQGGNATNPSEQDSGKIIPVISGSESFSADGVHYVRKRGVEAYLIMGIDRTTEQIAKRGTGGQADVLLLMVLDSETDSYQILQINRDTMTQITVLSKDGEIAGERFSPICLAHSFGSGGEDSCENTVRALSYLFSDIAIDGYFAINLDSLSIINAAVGGVTVKIDKDMTAADPSFVSGTTVTLDETNIEAYVRARMKVGEDDNLNRMSRQKQYMTQWLAKAKERAQSNPSFLMDLVEDIADYSVTNMTEKKLASVMNNAYKYTNKGMLSLEGEYMMGSVYNEFYADIESLQQTIISLFYQEQTVD